MAIFSNQLGYAEEVDYGTRVAPSRFLDFNSESLKRNQERRESGGIRAGSIVRRADAQAVVPKGGNGDIEHELANKGFGLLFKHMLRATPVITSPDSTNAPTVRDMTFILGTEDLSLTTQIGRVLADGSGVQPFDYLGCVVEEWEIAQELDAYAMLTLTLDAREEDLAQSLAAASYVDPIARFIDGDDSADNLGLAITVAATAFEPRTASISGNNGLKLDRYALRRSSLKKVPLNAEFVGLTGEMEGEFDSMAIYDLFVSGELVPIVYDWKGPEIGTTGFFYGLTITMPSCQFEGETPETSGPGILDQTTPFVIFDDGASEPITVRYRTTDTTP